MTQHYRATCKSYGFRGRYWMEGEIAYDVKDSEGIMPELFAPVAKGETVPPIPEPDEDNTLSGLLPKVNTEGKVPETLHEVQQSEKRPAKKHAKPKK
jgi:hypothetical protein